jgi:hypothetical protein
MPTLLTFAPDTTLSHPYLRRRFRFRHSGSNFKPLRSNPLHSILQRERELYIFAMADQQNMPTFKLVLVGDGGTGKVPRPRPTLTV